jgi:hypothetical protein
MVTITNDKAAMMIEQALICAAKYRVLASSDSNPLMVQLFKENVLRLERTAARLKYSGNFLRDAPA